MEQAQHPHHTAPHPGGSKDQAGLLTQSLQPLRRRALWWVFRAFPSMAIPSAPRCEIRRLVMHVYPVALGFCEAVGIKAYGHERHTVPLGRRGKPIQKMCFMPQEQAHFWARKLQGRPGTTVAVP